MPTKKNKTSEKRLATNARYEASVDKVNLRIPKSADLELDQVKAAATREGVSVNAYIVQAIREKIEKEEKTE